MVAPVTQTRQLDAADPNGICLDQQTGGAGNLVINGAFAAGGVATVDQQRQVSLESAGNLSGVNFTITGTQEGGRIVSETLVGPNAATVATTVDFFTVTQIAVDGAVGTDVEIGTNAVGGSVPVKMDQNITPFIVTLAVIVTGTVNYTVQYSFDEQFAAGPPYTWINHTDLQALAVTAEGTLISNVKAVRILTNSGVGTARLEVLQAGTSGPV